MNDNIWIVGTVSFSNIFVCTKNTINICFVHFIASLLHTQPIFAKENEYQPVSLLNIFLRVSICSETNDHGIIRSVEHSNYSNFSTEFLGHVHKH